MVPLLLGPRFQHFFFLFALFSNVCIRVLYKCKCVCGAERSTIEIESGAVFSHPKSQSYNLSNHKLRGVSLRTTWIWYTLSYTRVVFAQWATVGRRQRQRHIHMSAWHGYSAKDGVCCVLVGKTTNKHCNRLEYCLVRYVQGVAHG